MDYDKIVPWVNRVSIKYALGYGKSYCPLCGKLLISDFDLHEVIFTRGHLRGVRWQKELFHPYNSIGLCHGECHVQATSDHGQRECIIAILNRFHYEDIVEWMSHLPFKSTELLDTALIILQEANDAKEKES